MFRRLISLVSLVALLGVATGARASVEGLWWDTSVVGEGGAFESQNDIVAITWYTYENGEPAFRTIPAIATYEVVSVGGQDRIQIRPSGTVFRTTNFTEDEAVGDFTALFVPTPDGLVGQVNAAGNVRTLVPFVYAYASPVEFYRGLWTVSNLEAPGLTSGAAIVVFAEETATLNDGTPARLFDTSNDDFGFVFFDEDTSQFILALFFSDGSYTAAGFVGNNDVAFGFGGLFNEDGDLIGGPAIVSAAALANSDSELDALAEVLGVSTNKRAGDAPALPSAALMRRTAATLAEMRQQRQ